MVRLTASGPLCFLSHYHSGKLKYFGLRLHPSWRDLTAQGCVLFTAADFANPLVLPGSSGPGSTIACPDPPSEDSVATIVSMGFSRDQAMKALRATVRGLSDTRVKEYSQEQGFPNSQSCLYSRTTVWSVLWIGSSVTLMTLMQKLLWTSQKGDQQLSPSLKYLWVLKCAMGLEVSSKQ